MAESIPDVVGVAALARFLKITPRRVQQLVDEGYIPKVGRNQYPFRVSVLGYFRSQMDAAVGGGDSNALDLAKLQKEQLEVRRRQIELAKLEGDLVGVDDHLQILGDALTYIRARILALPGAWGPRIVGLRTPAQATQMMRILADETINDLARVADEIESPTRDKPIPPDFPGFKHLAAANITSFTQLRQLDELTSIRGIGTATAQRILHRIRREAA